MILAKGTVLIVEWGEYSDRAWTGPLVVARDFDPAEAMRKYRAQFSERVEEALDIWRSTPNPEGFVAWLSRSGLVEDLPTPAKRWWVGTCGDLADESRWGLGGEEI